MDIAVSREGSPADECIDLRTPFPKTGVEPATLVDLLCWRASHEPERRAYTFLGDGEAEERRVSYGELDRQAQAVAAQLDSLGVAGGERALLFYPPGLKYVAAFLGCLYAGVVAVPAYPPRLNRSISRLQAIVADSKATVALTTTRILSSLERRSAYAPEMKSLRWLATDDGKDPAGSWRRPEMSANTLALLQYTSGSTAAPKGVKLTHGNLLHNLAMIYHALNYTSHSQGVTWLPPYHDMGLIGGVLQPLYAGFPVALMSPISFLQQPLKWLQAISRLGAKTSVAPNFAYDLCVRRTTLQERATLDLSGWEVAITGAEPIRQEILERFVAAFAPRGFCREAFYPAYGLAEATLFVSGGLKATPPVVLSVKGAELERDRVVPAPAAEEGAPKLVGCGRTLADQKVVVGDPGSLTRCPPDRVGEIWVSGPSVAQGYWGQGKETEHTFRVYLAGSGEGPFLRTGDLGFLHNGELFVTGRLKELIVIRGSNHYPQDIEQTVEQSHTALRPGGCAAFSVDTADGERLVIVQELERRHARSADVGEVVASIRRAVAEHHGLEVHAVALIKTGSLSKTSSGKIQRGATRAAYTDGTLAAVATDVLPPAGAGKHDRGSDTAAPGTPAASPGGADTERVLFIVRDFLWRRGRSEPVRP